MRPLGIIAKENLNKVNNESFETISEEERKQMVKAGYVCRMMNSYRNQILDICRNIQNSEDETQSFVLTYMPERKHSQFALWAVPEQTDKQRAAEHYKNLLEEAQTQNPDISFKTLNPLAKVLIQTQIFKVLKENPHARLTPFDISAHIWQENDNLNKSDFVAEALNALRPHNPELHVNEHGWQWREKTPDQKAKDILEQMHTLSMQLETLAEDLTRLETTGDFDEIREQIESLTSDIQTKIEEF